MPGARIAHFPNVVCVNTDIFIMSVGLLVMRTANPCPRLQEASSTYMMSILLLTGKGWIIGEF
jgi:hypothetical protein